MHWQAFHKKKSLYLKAYLTKYVTTQKRICSKINRMSKKHTKRILGYEGDRPFWHFFDLKAYLIMAFMMRFACGRHIPGHIYCILLYRSRVCTGVCGYSVSEKSHHLP